MRSPSCCAAHAISEHTFFSFEFVDEPAVEPGVPRAELSRCASAPVPLPQPAHTTAGGLGFTFSPVSAPSPPMSLTGFSWRSATDEEEDGDDAGSVRGAADGLSETSSPSGSAPLKRAPPCEQRSPDAFDSHPRWDGSVDEGGGSHHESDTALPAAADPPLAPSAEPALEVLTLRVVTAVGRTGFEEDKDFPIVLGSTVAGRYQLVEYLGSAAFSKAVQAHDLQTGALVCLKIIKNSKDFFDQSLDEIKLLKHINAADPADEHGVRAHSGIARRQEADCCSLRATCRPPALIRLLLSQRASVHRDGAIAGTTRCPASRIRHRTKAEVY